MIKYKSSRIFKLLFINNNLKIGHCNNSFFYRIKRCYSSNSSGTGEGDDNGMNDEEIEELTQKSLAFSVLRTYVENSVSNNSISNSNTTFKPQNKFKKIKHINKIKKKVNTSEETPTPVDNTVDTSVDTAVDTAVDTSINTNNVHTEVSTVFSFSS